MNLYIFNFKLFAFVFFTTVLVSMIFTLFMVESHLKKNIKLNKSLQNYKYLFSNGKADWIALGDSHVANSLSNSSWLDNLGYASDNFISLEEKAFRRIIRLKPKGIILPADPHIFSFYRLFDNQKEKTKFLTTKTTYFFSFLNPINRPYLVNIIKSIYINKFKYLFGIKKNKIKKIDWVDTPIKQRNYETSIRVQLHTPILQFKSHPYYQKYKKMIKSYLDLNIKVCLVRYPVSTLYFNETKSIDIFNQVNSSFKSIAMKYNINFVDLSNVLENNKFSDTDHIKPEYKRMITNLIKYSCGIND